MKDIELQISQFIDQELSDTEQKELFTVLFEDEKARRVLSDYIQLKKKTSDHYSNIRADLTDSVENKIETNQLIKQKNNFKNQTLKNLTPTYTNYALGIIIIAITLFSFLQLSSLRSELNVFQEKYSNSIQQIKEQTEMVKILMKSLPPVKVTPYDSGNIIRTNL